MKAFGLELRRTGSVSKLWSDVDRVLENAGVTCESVGGLVQQQTVAHSLQKMLASDSFFSVCTIDSCAKLVGLVIPAERQRVYQACHCVHWNEMTQEYRQVICAMVLDDFRHVLTAEQ